MKNFYKKHVNKIVIILFALLVFKSCNSCTSNRRNEYTANQYEMIIDSLRTDIESLESYVKNLKDTININAYKIHTLQERERELIENNSHLNIVNRELVKTTKNLSDK